jgi:hypothetical protein
MVNGHPNLVRICSYEDLAVIVAMLVRSVQASTHFDA